MSDQPFPQAEIPTAGASSTGIGEALGASVEFVLGNHFLSLQELESLHEGYVFELPGLSVDSVGLRINGRDVGRGRLVRVGDHLGVVVESLGA
jgi:flagellar motor switch/type III secretory pathway protein FliN